MTLKGRHWVMLTLLVLLVTLVSVTMRQTSGVNVARELRSARDEHAALEAQRGDLERRIRQASSRQVLVPRAEAALGLHEPAATEMTVLTLPAESPGGLPPEATATARPDSAAKAPAKAHAAPKAAVRKAPARRAPARPARKPTRAPTRGRRH